MAEEWHYANESNEQVPVSEEQLKQLAASGQVTAETLVWNPDLPDWAPCGSVQPEWFVTESPEVKSQAPPPGEIEQPSPGAPPTLPPEIHSSSSGQAYPLAIASLICGILSLLSTACLSFFGLPIIILAIVCGHMARNIIRKHGNQIPGNGLAIAGLIMGYLSLAFLVIVMVGVILALSAGGFDVNP